MSSKTIQKLNNDKRNLCPQIRWKYVALIDLTQHRGHAVLYHVLTASHDTKFNFKSVVCLVDIHTKPWSALITLTFSDITY